MWTSFVLDYVLSSEVPFFYALTQADESSAYLPANQLKFMSLWCGP